MRVDGPPLPARPVETVVELLERAAGSSRGLIFVDADESERRLPWAELQLRAMEVARRLTSLGVQQGDTVALVLPTGEDFMEAFFGIQLAGAVPVPLYPPVRLGRLGEYHAATARMLTVCGARLVLTDARVRLLLGESVARARPALGCLTMEALHAVMPASRPRVRVAPEALGLIQYSSGSTMDPKPVALSHRALISQCASLHARLGLPEDGAHVGVCWLPLYHDMGLIGCLLTAAYYPGDLVLLPPELFLARPALWLRAISRHRATISPAPNFAYGLCLKRVKDAELEGVDLSSWRFALNGAEPVSAGILERFAQRFGAHGLRDSALLPVYGLSEAALALTFPPEGQVRPRVLHVESRPLAASGEVRLAVPSPMPLEAATQPASAPPPLPEVRELVSVGVPVAGVSLEVRDGLGHALGEGRVGRIWARSASLMDGYFGQQEATASALQAGWLDTGDLGFLQGGQLFLCGRAKDVVIIRGANHPPQAFEEALLGLPGVRTGCSVAVGFTPPEAQDEALLILLEGSGDAREGLEERVRAAVVAATGIRPHTVAVLAPGTLPRTSSGKLRRQEALRRHLGGTLKAPVELGPVRLATELARSAWGLFRAGGGSEERPG